jgi:hypothetical protein
MIAMVNETLRFRVSFNALPRQPTLRKVISTAAACSSQRIKARHQLREFYPEHTDVSVVLGDARL